jgi:hypothetical protein
MPSTPDPATRTAVRVVRALALLAIGVVAVGFVVLQDEPDDEPAAPVVQASTTLPPGVPAAVDELLADRADALAAADGRHDAVVSLISYRGVESVTAIAERAGVEVVAVLVAPPGGPPALVTASLTDWIEERRAAATEERAALAEILPTVDPGDPFAAAYLEDIARLDAELAGLDTGADLIYGFTTTASADALRALALRADVRLVDVDGLLPLGLRPEEVARVGEPPTRS